MTRHKRSKELSEIDKRMFRDAAERFHGDLQVLFRNLESIIHLHERIAMN